MIKHLNKVHFQEINIETLEFQNEEELKDFKKWKDMEFFMSTVKHKGSLYNEKNKCTYTYHVSNFDVQKREKHVHRIPDVNCPARFLQKKYEDGKIKVKFVNHHTHPIDVENLKYHQYPKESLDYAKTMLSKNVRPRTVRDDFVPRDADERFPIKEHFISIKQIRDLKYRMLKSLRYNSDDGEAVRILADKLHREGDSVLLYKPQGTTEVKYGPQLIHAEDTTDIFVFAYQNKRMLRELVNGACRIVCADATHGTNRYSFSLLLLVVPDEYNKGYPVAFLISNKMDIPVLTYFFESIRRRCPQLKVNALMTDDDKVIFPSFQTAFGSDVKHLLCHWHVKVTWSKRIFTSVKDEALATDISATLETLLKEPEIAHFKAMLRGFLEKYSEIKGCEDFVQYFDDNYAGRSEKWALSYRKFPHAGTDTNNYCESTNRVIKDKLVDNANTTLVDLILVLIDVEWDKSRDLRTCRVFKKPLPAVRKPTERFLSHQRGIKMSNEAVQEVSADKWLIQSESREDIMHTVTLFHQTCSLPDHCQFQCKQKKCQGLCSHMYICSCEDRFPLCKHIHKIHSMRVKALPTGSQADDLETEEEEEEIELQNDASNKKWKLHNTPPSSLPKFSVDKASKKVSECKRIFRKLCEGIDDKDIQESLLHHIHGTAVQLESMFDSVKAQTVDFPPIPTMDYEKQAPNQKRVKQTLKRTRKERKVVKTASYVITAPKEVRFTIKKYLADLDPSVDSDDLSYYVASSWDELVKPRFKINGESVSMLHLKTLIADMTDSEYRRIRFFDDSTRPPNQPVRFIKGYLCDTIIDSFLFIKLRDCPDSTFIYNWQEQRLTDPRSTIPDVTRRLKSLPLQNKTKVFIFLNPTRVHWVLLFCDVLNRIIYFLDPMEATDYPLVEAADIYKDAIKRWVYIMGTYYNHASWKVAGMEHTLQADGYICGVYVCWYVEQLSKNKTIAIDFDPAAYRVHMLRVIWSVGRDDPIVYPEELDDDDEVLSDSDVEILK